MKRAKKTPDESRKTSGFRENEPLTIQESATFDRNQ